MSSQSLEFRRTKVPVWEVSAVECELTQRVRAKWRQNDRQGVLAELPDGWKASVDSPADLALLHFWRGDALFKLQRYVEAAPEFRAAYDLIAHVRDAEDAVWVLLGYATKQGRSWDLHAAVRLSHQALALSAPHSVQRAFAKWHLGWWMFKAGAHVDGLRVLEEAVQLMAEDGGRSDAIAVAVDLMECLLDARHLERALELMLAYRASVSECGLRLRARFDYLQGRAALASGHLDEAGHLVAAAFTEARAASDKQLCADAASLAMRIAAETGGEAEPLAQLALNQCIVAQDGALVRNALAVCQGRGETA